MQLFSGVSEQLIEKAFTNEIGITLSENFRRYIGYNPTSSEVRSWIISLKDLSISLQSAGLQDTGVVVEYRLPLSSRRLDAMILGHSRDSREGAVIVELKQWDKAYKCGIKDCVSFAPNNPTDIRTHPSRQAGSYAEYLKGMHTAFYSNDDDDYIDLRACSFLHNANSRMCGDLLDNEFEDTLSHYPLFTGDTRAGLEEYLSEYVGKADGKPVLQKVLASKYMPSKKLLEHVAEMIDGNPVFTLLDEQLIAYNLLMSKVHEMERRTSKAVILVRGGPGTGKSVIAVKLLGDLAKSGRNVVHCTGSKAFTTNLRAKVGRKASSVFKYFNQFVNEEPNSIDVIVADEAHRIRESSNTRFSRKSSKAQIDELIDAAKIVMFLLDDNQVVRPGEVGTTQLIRQVAKKSGAEFYELELKGQFRCSGSESYLNWLDHVFMLGGEPDVSWKEDYIFEICDSPEELEQRVLEKFNEGYSARMVAGFCWDWSNPDPNGALVDDVVIEDWEKPWNRKARGSEPPDRHPYTLWASEDVGVAEVGCIYSAQGFEFDYCGVIFGDDLVWDNITNNWRANKENSYDTVVKRSDNLERLLCNTYRVLMSRGMNGTFVYFTDKNTRAYFEHMLDNSQ
jgi:hypothetical protein